MRSGLRTGRPLSRRTFLRGTGAALALPMLEAMLPVGRRAAAMAAPKRLLVYYVPNGIHMPAWTPAVTGAAFDLPPILAPLAPLRSEILVVTGLANRPAESPELGDHARGTASFLSCTSITRTEGADIQNGISVDQVAAATLGADTLFPSLQLGGEGGAPVGNCDNGYSCAYARNVSWAGPSSPLAKETSPRAAFDRLVQGSAAGVTPEERARKRLYRGSVLDLVMEDAARLQARLGATDQQKVDEYLTGVRELERRIGLLDDAVCEGAPPQEPAGDDLPARVRAMADVMVLAFECDLTRVITFMLANAASNVVYPHLGVFDGHHQISHHQENPALLAQLQTIDTWEVEELAYLLGRLAATPAGDGSLLDQTLVYFSSEIEDGDRHRHRNLPVLLAGRAGGAVSPGRHVRHQNEPPLADLYVAMLQALGVPATRFGNDGTAALAGIVA